MIEISISNERGKREEEKKKERKKERKHNNRNIVFFQKQRKILETTFDSCAIIESESPEKLKKWYE